MGQGAGEDVALGQYMRKALRVFIHDKIKVSPQCEIVRLMKKKINGLYTLVLLLGRKVMTNLDSILKSKDITLPTKVCLVKAMVFLVVMYGCESWTIKKAECEE